MTVILSHIYECSLLVASILAVVRYRKVDIASRLICWLVWLGLITETVAYCAAKKYHTNYPVYNTSLFFEYTLICLYFNYSVLFLKQRKAGIYLAVGGIMLGLINTCFIQSYTKMLDSNFMFFECLIVVSLSLFAIYRFLLVDDDNMKLYRKVHFWLPCTLVLYQAGSLFAWGFYSKFGDNDTERAVILDLAILTINIITYTSYSSILLFYPKLRLIHVQR